VGPLDAGKQPDAVIVGRIHWDQQYFILAFARKPKRVIRGGNMSSPANPIAPRDPGSKQILQRWKFFVDDLAVEPKIGERIRPHGRIGGALLGT